MTPAAMPCEATLRQRRARKRGTHQKDVAILGKGVQSFDLGWQHEDGNKEGDLRHIQEVIIHDRFNLRKNEQREEIKTSFVTG